ncbi:hypothetical protein OC834_003573 [Tilletia horrida]|nr:hypothetical protein OC834_003573 [Tilletia horrida]
MAAARYVLRPGSQATFAFTASSTVAMEQDYGLGGQPLPNLRPSYAADTGSDRGRGMSPPPSSSTQSKSATAPRPSTSPPLRPVPCGKLTYPRLNLQNGRNSHGRGKAGGDGLFDRPAIRARSLPVAIILPYLQGLDGEDTSCRESVAYGAKDFDQASFADRIVIPEAFTHIIPDSLSLAEAAPLQCAGATVFGAIYEAGVSSRTHPTRFLPIVAPVVCASAGSIVANAMVVAGLLAAGQGNPAAAGSWYSHARVQEVACYLLLGIWLYGF